MKSTRVKILRASLFALLLLFTVKAKSQVISSPPPESRYTTLKIYIGSYPDSMTSVRFSKSLVNSYDPKIVATAASFSEGTVTVTFDPSLLTEENLLQIIRMDGYYNPCYFDGYTKYLLDAHGNLVSEDVKH
ncbi:MAG TPA: hypothetical protein VFU15_03835 [Bacteroidia bacterium]|nr:hypothetical protein [Bacteroidia bacterium]